jgi:ribose 5-phosphate isomerase B
MVNYSYPVPIACDHGGFDMKEHLMKVLRHEGYQLIDYGVNSPDSVDYPDIIHPLSQDIEEGKFPLGIIICGSGNGAQMVANKYPNVRAALCWNEEITSLARQHNDANILSLPGRFLDFEYAARLARIFLETPFEGGRHSRRVKKIPCR